MRALQHQPSLTIEQYVNILGDTGFWHTGKGWYQKFVSYSRKRERSYFDYLFQDIDSFNGKSMLDVGGGYGLFSFYAALRGSRQVVCLEPELAGGSGTSLAKFMVLSKTLGLKGVSFSAARLQDFDAHDRFDIILLHASINHLDEEACARLEFDEDARKKYYSLMTKLSNLTATGGITIVADCSRSNFFAFLRMKNPFLPTIEWHKHQRPELWCTMLSEHGYTLVKLHWTPILFRGPIGRRILGHRYVSYFLTSEFVLVMRKN